MLNKFRVNRGAVTTSLFTALVFVGAGCDPDCSEGVISEQCPAEPETAPNDAGEPEEVITSPPTNCEELVLEFEREANSRAGDHDTCASDDDCIATAPVLLCGDTINVAACPVAVAANTEGAFTADLASYSSALCVASDALACQETPTCAASVPTCSAGTCILSTPATRSCAEIEDDFAVSILALASDGRNTSAADNCVLRTESLDCDGAILSSPCPVAVGPNFADTFDASLAALRADLCAEAATLPSACVATSPCTQTGFVAGRDGLQCVAELPAGSCPSAESMLQASNCPVPGQVCEVPCAENDCVDCGFTAECREGRWFAGEVRPPARCYCPADLDAAVGETCPLTSPGPFDPPPRCTDACVDIRCTTNLSFSPEGTWAYASVPGQCDPCVTAVEGETCSVDGTFCSSGCSDVCSFCNVLSCSEGSWSRLEVFPAQCDECPTTGLPTEGTACAATGQRCESECDDPCGGSCQESVCTDSGWSAPAAPGDDVCQCPAFVEDFVGDRCEAAGLGCENNCTGLTCNAFGRWREAPAPADCAACPASGLDVLAGTTCTDDGLTCREDCGEIQCDGSNWVETQAFACDGGPGVDDAGVADAGVADAGVADAGVADAGVADAGVADAGVADAGVADAGVADAG